MSKAGTSMYDCKKRLWLILLIGLFLSVIVLSGLSSTINLALLKKHSEYLKAMVHDFYTTTVLIYIGLLALVVALALPLSIFFALVSGFLFGPVLGAFYSVIGGTLGCAFCFLSVRYVAHEWCTSTAGTSFASFKAQIEQYGIYYVVFLQMLPFTPFAVVAVLSALSPISFRSFCLGTFLGIIPANAIIAYAGKRLMSLKNIADIWSWHFSGLLMASTFVAGILILVNHYRSKS